MQPGGKRIEVKMMVFSCILVSFKINKKIKECFSFNFDSKFDKRSFSFILRKVHFLALLDSKDDPGK